MIRRRPGQATPTELQATRRENPWLSTGHLYEVNVSCGVRALADWREAGEFGVFVAQTRWRGVGGQKRHVILGR